MKNKILIVIISICMISVMRFNTILATSTESETRDFWGDAGAWFDSAKQDEFALSEQAGEIIDVLSDMINVVGTTIIVVATIVLGLKFIVGTVDSKTSAKEGLITLFVACVFFFGWASIRNLLFPDNNFIFITSKETTYQQMLGNIFSVFSYVCNIVAILLVIYVGVRYILAGASGRADLKGRSVSFIIGIILVFATSNVLTFISNIITEAL